jgi:16S rRNA processing protein RimM
MGGFFYSNRNNTHHVFVITLITTSMIPEKKDLHKLGFFNRLHGYKGELTAALDTDDIRSYTGLQHIYVEVKGILTPYFIELIEYKTNTTAKVKLEGIDNEEKAKMLVKSSIYVEPKDLSEDDADKVAMREIAGYAVFDEEKGEIGKVLRIEDTGNNPLLVVISGKKELLFPLNNEDLFREIDKKKKEVHITAPPGLIDFYLEL